MNIAEILKKCPKGTKLYSPLFGDVELESAKDDAQYSIVCLTTRGIYEFFANDGKYYNSYPDSECLLFPSKTQRDWNKFGVNEKETKHQFKPFDKVLVRNADTREWICDFFIKERRNSVFRFGCIVSGAWKQCIPYEGNEHLFGTTNNPEE